jgi:hypothetical protein
MGLRSTYDTGLFGSGLFGEPETTQAAASASVGISAVASADTVIDASASATIAVSVTPPTAIRIVDASASVSLGGIVSVSAVKYEVIPGFRPGYGLNTYGSYLYGKNISIEEGSASAAIGVSTSVSAQAVRQSGASPSIAVVFTANGVIDVVGRASVTISISPNIAYNRVRLFSGTSAIAISTSVSARYKWLDADDPSTTWTLAPNPSNTWAEADYLERAA